MKSSNFIHSLSMARPAGSVTSSRVVEKVSQVVGKVSQVVSNQAEVVVAPSPSMALAALMRSGRCDCCPAM